MLHFCLWYDGFKDREQAIKRQIGHQTLYVDAKWIVKPLRGTILIKVLYKVKNKVQNFKKSCLCCMGYQFKTCCPSSITQSVIVCLSLQRLTWFILFSFLKVDSAGGGSKNDKLS